MYDDVIKHIEKIEDQLNNKSQPKPISKPHTGIHTPSLSHPINISPSYY